MLVLRIARKAPRPVQEIAHMPDRHTSLSLGWTNRCDHASTAVSCPWRWNTDVSHQSLNRTGLDQDGPDEGQGQRDVPRITYVMYSSLKPLRGVAVSSGRQFPPNIQLGSW